MVYCYRILCDLIESFYARVCSTLIIVVYKLANINISVICFINLFVLKQRQSNVVLYTYRPICIHFFTYKTFIWQYPIGLRRTLNKIRTKAQKPPV